MSSTVTYPEQFERPDGRKARWLPAWAREPLLHFILLGAALFGLDHVLALRTDDPRLIVVGAEVDRQAIELFMGSRGRAPTGKELTALRKVWLDNEVLYREGLALQLDKGDTAIRERVIFKALSVVDANLAQPHADERSLRTWFEQHRGKYDEPARYDFEEAVLGAGATESDTQALVDSLNRDSHERVDASLRVFKGRPRSNVVDGYGEPFAAALEASTPLRWRVLPARTGWRAVRLVAATPAKPAQFEVLRDVVTQDWLDVTMAERRSAAVAALARKYTIRNETAQ